MNYYLLTTPRIGQWILSSDPLIYSLWRRTTTRLNSLQPEDLLPEPIHLDLLGSGFTSGINFTHLHQQPDQCHYGSQQLHLTFIAGEAN